LHENLYLPAAARAVRVFTGHPAGFAEAVFKIVLYLENNGSKNAPDEVKQA
jgi:hypothetical protein